MQNYEKIFLENEFILVEIVPWDGGRISRIFDKEHSCELIWSNPRTKDVRRYYGCDYDDLSASGIEEAFPTVQPCITEDGKLLMKSGIQVRKSSFFCLVFILLFAFMKVPDFMYRKEYMRCMYRSI